MRKADENMELTDSYRSATAPDVSPYLEYTVQYNVHNGAGSEISALHSSRHRFEPVSGQKASSSHSYLRRSFTESYLEPIGQSASANATTTINLNTFNQQKRIQRLLSSVLGLEYKFPQPRQMKDYTPPPSLDFAAVHLFYKEPLIKTELDILTISNDKKDADRILSQLKDCLAELADLHFSNGPKYEEETAQDERARALESIKQIYTFNVNFPKRVPYFGGFSPNFRITESCFTLKAGELGIMRVFVGSSVRSLLRASFPVQFAIGEQFEPVRQMILEGIPAGYRLEFEGQQNYPYLFEFLAPSSADSKNWYNQAKQVTVNADSVDYAAYYPSNYKMQILTPFSTLLPDKEFATERKSLGTFLLEDFYGLMKEISYNLGYLIMLLEKVQARPELLLYLGTNQIYISGQGKCVYVVHAFPLEARMGDKHVMGADAVLGYFS